MVVKWSWRNSFTSYIKFKFVQLIFYLFLGLRSKSLGTKLGLGLLLHISFSFPTLSLNDCVSRDISGIMECLGLLLISGNNVFLTLSGSTGLTAILALLPGLVAADLVPLVWGDAAALREALLRREEVLRCSILVDAQLQRKCVVIFRICNKYHNFNLIVHDYVQILTMTK